MNISNKIIIGAGIVGAVAVATGLFLARRRCDYGWHLACRGGEEKQT